MSDDRLALRLQVASGSSIGNQAFIGAKEQTRPVAYELFKQARTLARNVRRPPIDLDRRRRRAGARWHKSLGYETRTFISAEHFLESGAIAQTACLITDLQMPGLNGLELQAALRSEGCCIPIILITAFPNEKHRNRALEGGALGFLGKPFDEVIADAMPDRRNRAANLMTGLSA